MNRTDHSMSGFLGLRMAEESKLAEYYHGEYESHSPGPKYRVNAGEMEDSTAVFDTFDAVGYKAELIAKCKLFQEEIKRRAYQATTMLDLYTLINRSNDWDDALPGDINPSWKVLERIFCICEGRVRALIRKTAGRMRQAVLRFVKNSPELSIQIGNVKGMLFTFSKQEQYAYAWEVIAGK